MYLRIPVCGLLCVCLGGPVQADDVKVVSGPLVVSDAWPECTHLLTWTRDVMRIEGLDNATETAQAKAFFRWLRLFSKMATGGMIQAYEGDYLKESSVLDVHKNLFVYGWGFCDTHIVTRRTPVRLPTCRSCDRMTSRITWPFTICRHPD